MKNTMQNYNNNLNLQLFDLFFFRYLTLLKGIICPFKFY